MGTAATELPNWINRTSVEYAHGRALEAQRMKDTGMAQAGMRAARARDPKLLKALEGGAEILVAMSNTQLGVHYKADNGCRMDATEAQMWREAYRLCDEGNPIGNLEWIYGAAAVLSGLYP